MASGTYALEGSSLTIEPGATTMAYCGDQSLDQQYLALLANVASYTKVDGKLVLVLKDSAGEMTFK
jgi:heat shock protein HslJ